MKIIRTRPYKGKGKRTHKKPKLQKNQLTLELKNAHRAKLNPVWA